MSDKPVFIDGLMAKKPHENAPDFMKASISIKRADLIAWLQGRDDEWINADVKESKGGKWYAALNDYKPQTGRGAEPPPENVSRQRHENTASDKSGFKDDDIPF